VHVGQWSDEICNAKTVGIGEQDRPVVWVVCGKESKGQRARVLPRTDASTGARWQETRREIVVGCACSPKCALFRALAGTGLPGSIGPWPSSTLVLLPVAQPCTETRKPASRSLSAACRHTASRMPVHFYGALAEECTPFRTSHRGRRSLSACLQTGTEQALKPPHQCHNLIGHLSLDHKS
jgi:hypothetical protein